MQTIDDEDMNGITRCTAEETKEETMEKNISDNFFMKNKLNLVLSKYSRLQTRLHCITL